VIRVDNREGSADLAAPLTKRGLPVELTRLAYGDLCWFGDGPEGVTLVGVEHKTVSDVLNCITSQRFTGHQLPGMQDVYAPWTYLLVEGEWRVSHDGALLVERKPGWWAPAPGGRKTWMFRDLAHWLSTVVNQGGMRLVRTASRDESLAWVHSEYTWWTSKSWDGHKSIAKAHWQPARRAPAERFELVKPKKPSRLERLYAQLFGWETAATVIQSFPALGQAVAASDKQWLRIEGIGPEMLRRWRSVC